MNAIALAILSCVKSGDHILIVDTAYGPTRHFADTVLPGIGVSVTFYDPKIGADIKTLFQENTTAVFTEAPGSLTFEMQDVPAIAAEARAIGATVLMDNTWASPIYCQPLSMGVDLSIQAGTKYLVGHSDAMLGTVAASERAWENWMRSAVPWGVTSRRMTSTSACGVSELCPCALNGTSATRWPCLAG